MWWHIKITSSVLFDMYNVLRMRIPESAKKRCSHCKSYRVNVLHSGLSRLLKQGETQQEARSTTDSHVKHRYLSTPEKVERMHKLHSAL